MRLADGDLNGKTVLEVGTGRGATTRVLVDLLEKYSDTTLISTDASTQSFAELQKEFKDRKVRVKFMQTNAIALDGMDKSFVDDIVCNYSLPSIEAYSGRSILALRRFFEVLKPGGSLFIEDEFPNDRVQNTHQQVWAEKWRILKAATIMIGGISFNAIAPDTLVELCRIVGFEGIGWEEEISYFENDDVLDPYFRSLDRLIPALPNNNLRSGISTWAYDLRDKAAAGGMEVPSYRLWCRKAASA